jgi:hypothetical protein
MFGLAGIGLAALFIPPAPSIAQQSGDNTLEGKLECDSTTIAIGALPRVGCHVTITKWRTGTTDPVELKLPFSADAAGNQKNGLQIMGAGTIDPSAHTLPYRWDLSVFACPGTETGGPPCTDKLAFPHRTLLSVEIHQAGAKPAKLLSKLDVTGPAYAGPSLSGRKLFFGSASEAGQFFRLGTGDKIELGITTTSHNRAVWNVERVEGTLLVRLHNAAKKGRYLFVHNGAVVADYANPDHPAVHWEILAIPDTIFFTLRNSTTPDTYLKVADSKIVLGPDDPATRDARWWVLQ